MPTHRKQEGQGAERRRDRPDVRLGPELQNMLSHSVFSVWPGRFVYGRVRSMPVPERGRRFIVSHDGSSIVVATREENLERLKLTGRINGTYALIAVNMSSSSPSLKDDATSAINASIAKATDKFLIMTVFPMAYVLVNKGALEKAKQAISSIGIREIPLRE